MSILTNNNISGYNSNSSSLGNTTNVISNTTSDSCINVRSDGSSIIKKLVLLDDNGWEWEVKIVGGKLVNIPISKEAIRFQNLGIILD